MSLVSQGAFSLSSLPSVPGRRLRWSTAIPESSSGPDPAQGHEVHAAALRGAAVSRTRICPAAQAQLLGPLTPWGSPLGCPPQSSPLKMGDALRSPSISPGKSSMAGSAAATSAPALPVPRASQGWLPIYGAALQPGSPREGSVQFVPIYQPSFSSLTPPRGCVGVGKLRHGAAARRSRGCRV